MVGAAAAETQEGARWHALSSCLAAPQAKEVKLGMLGAMAMLSSKPELISRLHEGSIKAKRQGATALRDADAAQAYARAVVTRRRVLTHRQTQASADRMHADGARLRARKQQLLDDDAKKIAGDVTVGTRVLGCGEAAAVSARERSSTCTAAPRRAPCQGCPLH